MAAFVSRAYRSNERRAKPRAGVSTAIRGPGDESAVVSSRNLYGRTWMTTDSLTVAPESGSVHVALNVTLSPPSARSV